MQSNIKKEPETKCESAEEVGSKAIEKLNNNNKYYYYLVEIHHYNLDLKDDDYNKIYFVVMSDTVLENISHISSIVFDNLTFRISKNVIYIPIKEEYNYLKTYVSKDKVSSVYKCVHYEEVNYLQYRQFSTMFYTIKHYSKNNNNPE